MKLTYLPMKTSCPLLNNNCLTEKDFSQKKKNKLQENN